MNGGATHDAAALTKTLKEGERVLPPRAAPTEHYASLFASARAIHLKMKLPSINPEAQSKEMSAIQEVPPGYDQEAELKPKSKSAKRNERKKEKRQQAALNNNSEKDVLSADDSNNMPENVDLTSKMNGLSMSESSSGTTPPTNSSECPPPQDQVQDIDKKIRALKKKIRMSEAQQQKTRKADMNQEQIEKLEGWRSELKLLEDERSELGATM